MHAARAAGLFFLLQPITFLIHDVNVVIDTSMPKITNIPSDAIFLLNVILLLLKPFLFSLSDERLHL